LTRLGKTLEVTNDCSAPPLNTDIGILVRVITNMVKNALEAIARGGTVKLWAEDDESGCAFRVWNEGVIPDQIARQIFKRSFSTKQGRGRGLGTYSMKLLGEQHLGGKVSFTTSETEGTIFSITLPLASPQT
jgi:signal transduction histidine kinase